MPPLRTCSLRSAGFSLVELSVVLAIIALVVGMSLSAGSMQLDIARFNGTKQKLETVRTALNLFQKKMGRYPCPAEPQLAPSHANYGVEYNSGSCTAACPLGGLSCGTNAVIGMVPFKALRLPESLASDSWDYRLTYAVDKSHTASSEYELGTLPIQDAAGNEITASPVLGDAIFVLLSHGMDRNGGNGPTGTLKACGATAKDIENCDGDDTFMDAMFNNGTVAVQYFDDLIAWQVQENYEPPEEEEEEESTPTLATVAGRARHFCAIKAADTVWCWGLNDHNSLGDGSGSNKNSPVQAIGVTAAVDVATMGYDSCAVKSDGTVMCWGWNFTMWGAPAVETITDVVQLSGSDGAYMLALKRDGSVWWSDGGVWTAGAAGVMTQVAAAYNHECYIKADGTAWCDGENASGQIGDGNGGSDAAMPVQVLGLTNVSQISIANDISTAIQADGTLWRWGSGDLGGGNSEDTPVQVTALTGITAISTAYVFNCAVKSDGTVYCWGENQSKQLGNNSTVDAAYTAPVTANIAGVSEIATGSVVSGAGTTCAKKTTGEIWCWGEGSLGQLGNGASIDSGVPVQVQNFP